MGMLKNKGLSYAVMVSTKNQSLWSKLLFRTIVKDPNGVMHQKRWVSPIVVGQSLVQSYSKRPQRGHTSKRWVPPIVMGQSLVQNYMHIVWSTKNRKPLIVPEIEKSLHAYLAGACGELDSPAIKVGGYIDHIHLLCRVSKNIAISKLMEQIKKSSSKWAKAKGSHFSNFYWQDGYGAFSVSPSVLDRVVAYIENQHEHHKSKTFKDEFRHFLKKYKVNYDEKYVWD